MMLSASHIVLEELWLTLLYVVSVHFYRFQVWTLKALTDFFFSLSFENMLVFLGSLSWYVAESQPYFSGWTGGLTFNSTILRVVRGQLSVDSDD